METRRTILRAFAEADLEELLQEWNDPDVRRYLFDDAPVSRDVVREQIRLSRQRFDDGQPGFYRIALRSAPGETIGFAGLRTYGDEDRVEVLYALKPAYWGQGFATEAADAILERAFEDPNLAAVDAGADPPNVASFRVMRRLGMRLVGEVAIEGAPGPATYYRITREEFASRRRSS